MNIGHSAARADVICSNWDNVKPRHALDIINNIALIYESEIEIDTEHLNEKRIEMNEKKDTDILLKIIPGLNSIIEDAEKYKSWILEQFDK